MPDAIEPCGARKQEQAILALKHQAHGVTADRCATYSVQCVYLVVLAYTLAQSAHALFCNGTSLLCMEWVLVS